jgi:hypothetical protein
MKVFEGQGPILQQVQKKGHRKEAGESDFQRLMDQTRFQADKGGDGRVQRPLEPALDGIQILRGAEKVEAPEATFEKEKVMGALQETLDLVDFYADKLADSSLPITGINPLVDHLEERMETLRGMESTPGLPEKLRPLISDVVITIGTEIEKFRRGDYR